MPAINVSILSFGLTGFWASLTLIIENPDGKATLVGCLFMLVFANFGLLVNAYFMKRFESPTKTFCSSLLTSWFFLVASTLLVVVFISNQKIIYLFSGFFAINAVIVNFAIQGML